MKQIKARLVFAGLLVLVFSCNVPRPDVTEVDLSDGVERRENDDREESLRVAISTVISPRESFVYYRDLFNALSEFLDMPIEFKQRTTYQEVNEMLAQNMVDIAFVCSGAYLLGIDHMELLVAPVVQGRPYYRGYIIVNESGPIYRFSDLKGKRFTHSDPLCFTGKLFVDLKLSEEGTTADEFFDEVVYSLSHDVSIQMVARNVIDGAAVNGLIFEYLAAKNPELVAGIRIIEKTTYGGIPPVVNSLLMSRELQDSIREFFTAMHENPRTKPILDELQIDRFIVVGDTLYDGLRQIKERI